MVRPLAQLKHPERQTQFPRARGRPEREPGLQGHLHFRFAHNRVRQRNAIHRHRFVAYFKMAPQDVQPARRAVVLGSFTT